MPEPLSWRNTASQNTKNLMNMTEVKWLGWFENAGANMTEIRNGLDIKDIPQRKGPAVIVGGGPSYHRYRHQNLLQEFRDRIPTIISTDRMLKSLLAVQVEPHFVASIDGDPIVSEFYQIHSDERFPKTDVVFDAVTVHPLTLKTAKENLGGKVYWFTHFFDDPMTPRCGTCNRLSLTAGLHYMTKKTLIQAAGNVGAFAWHLAYFLGCDPIIMIGMDLSYEPDTPLDKTIYYDGFMKMVNRDPLKLRACYQVRANPDFHNKYMTDLIFDAYRDMIMPFIKRAKVTTINSTGGGALHGEPIKGIGFEEALRKYCR